MKNLPLITKIIVVLFFIALSILLALESTENEQLQEVIYNFGYLGIFITSIVSGFNVLFPVPIITLAPAFVAGGLNFWLVIATISLGLTLGDLFGFLVGNVGRELSRGREQNIKLVRFLINLIERSPKAPYVLMFLYAALIPFPNEVLVIPLAFLGCRLRYLFPTFLLGNFVFNAIYGHVGITLFKFL